MCARTSTARAWPCLALSFLALSASPSTASAQTGGTCVRIEERAGRDLGCFITAREELGSISKDSVWFWHQETFPSRTRAENEKGLRGTVVESFGEIWLFTIADSAWKSKTGTRVARIGPIPLVDAARYAAVYMEGVFAPGMASEVHRHPGAEAWYTLAGEMCLE